MSKDIFIAYKRNAAHAPVYAYSNVRDFSPEEIFECGQCFRWRSAGDGGYVGVVGGHIAKLEYDEKEQYLRITEMGKNTLPSDGSDFWMEYLDLNRDYGTIKRKLSKNDPAMKEAISYGKGIRILKQDFWETIVSFIISQNNNIPRIKGCIEKLAKELGKPIELAGTEKDKKPVRELLERVGLTVASIPEPKVLANLKVEDLAPVRLGYRAKYLIETAKWVEGNGLPKTFEDLGLLCGVGPKVANCIGLFGMGKMDSFPIDVWVKRVMNKVYGFSEDDIKGMSAFAEEKFGPLGGIAQQYLFYYIRQTEN